MVARPEAPNPGSTAPPRRPRPGLPRTFESLADPQYRLYWGATAFSSSGQWMEIVITNWLLLELENSAFLLGLLNFTRAVPMLLFGLLGGTIADRFDRKTILIWTQLVLLALFAALFVLAVTGTLQIWHLFLVSGLGGAAWAVNQPTRQSITSDITPRERLMNAVALSSAAIQGSRIFGPSLAGLLMLWLTPIGALASLSINYLLVILWTVMLHVPEQARREARAATPSQGIWADVMEGLRYVRQSPPLFAIVLIAMLPMVFGQPYQTLVTVFVRDVYQADAGVYGVLMAAPGIGALAVTLLLATFSRMERRGWVISACAIGFGLSVLAYAFTTNPETAFVILVVLGFFMIGMMSTSNTMVQTLAPPAMRGRVLGIWTLNRGMQPFGSVLAGGLASVLGPPLAMGIMGLLTLGSAATLIWRLPALRNLR